MLEYQHRRHRIESVNLPCDVGECRARINISLEFNREKEIGVVDGVINAPVFMEGDRLLGVVLDFVSGELEEEVGCVPFVEVCLLSVYLSLRVKIFEERRDGIRVSVEGALTFVA